jgi:hypothetical protein
MRLTLAAGFLSFSGVAFGLGMSVSGCHSFCISSLKVVRGPRLRLSFFPGAFSQAHSDNINSRRLI